MSILQLFFSRVKPGPNHPPPKLSWIFGIFIYPIPLWDNISTSCMHINFGQRVLMIFMPSFFVTGSHRDRVLSGFPNRAHDRSLLLCPVQGPGGHVLCHPRPLCPSSSHPRRHLPGIVHGRDAATGATGTC